jgi:tetratricopeptide (TPR) repeat protein
MSHQRVAPSLPRRTRAHVVVLLGVLALALAAPGCPDGQSQAGRDLDGLLTRTGQILEQRGVQDARVHLLADLRVTAGGWKGARAGAAYRMLGDLSVQCASIDSAMQFYTCAEESYRGQLQRHEAFLMSLAVVKLYRDIQLTEEAAERGADVLRLATLFGDSAAVQDIRWVLLDLYCTLEQPAEMERSASALRAICRASGDRAGEARIEFVLGQGEARRNVADAAIGRYLQCVTLAGKAKDSVLVVRALLALATTFERTGRLREAHESFSAALLHGGGATVEPSLRFQVMLRIGNFYLRNGKPETALPYFEKASAVAQQITHAVGKAYALLQQAHCQKPTARDEAGSLLRKSYDILQRTGHFRGRVYALISLGQSAERENRTTDAAQLYRAATLIQESTYANRTGDDLWLDCEESVMGRGGADSHGAMISLLLLQGNTEEAFWYQERSNSRRLSSDLAGWNVTTGVTSTDSLMRSYLYQRALHVGAEGQLETLASSAQGTAPLLAEISRVLDRLEERIEAEGARTGHADHRLNAITMTDGLKTGDVQKALAEDAILLAYLPTNRSLYTCVVTPSRCTRRMAAVSQERVIDLAEEYLRECTLRAGAADSVREQPRGQDTRMEELTRALYEAMILPVESELTAGSRLLIVLPARFPAIPLAGMRRGGGPGTPALGERFALSYLPTARYALSGGTSSATVRTVTALGVRGTTVWDVEYELNDIRAFYRDARLVFGKDATIASLRLAHQDLLHMSLEVRFCVQRPLTGAFIMGDGAAADGTTSVPLAMVFSLPPTPSVVLINLSPRLPATHQTVAAAFLANGSTSVILNAASLTRKAKKMFGEGFYTALQSGASVPAALRTAQNAMARTKGLSAPYFWTPLMVWGK